MEPSNVQKPSIPQNEADLYRVDKRVLSGRMISEGPKKAERVGLTALQIFVSTWKSCPTLAQKTIFILSTISILPMSVYLIYKRIISNKSVPARQSITHPNPATPARPATPPIDLDISPSTQSISPVEERSPTPPTLLETPPTPLPTLFRGNLHNLKRSVLQAAVSKAENLGSETFAKMYLGAGDKRSIRRLPGRAILLDVQHKTFEGKDKVMKVCYKIIENNGYWEIEKVAFLKHLKEQIPTSSMVNPHLAGFHHPNVDNVSDAFLLPSRKGGGMRQAYVAPLANGDLSNLPQTTSIKERLKICQDLLSGLEAIHARGLVHQDIKTENCLFTRTDDGYSAKISDCTDVAPTLTPRQTYTLELAAPEVRDGAPIIQESDVYAMGKTIQEIVTPMGHYLSHGDKTLLSCIIYFMTQDDPKKRPKISDVLPKIREIVSHYP